MQNNLLLLYCMINEGFVVIFSILSEFFNRNSSAYEERDGSMRRFNKDAGNEISISPIIRVFQLKIK
jgi:hypothetical protein